MNWLDVTVSRAGGDDQAPGQVSPICPLGADVTLSGINDQAAGLSAY